MKNNLKSDQRIIARKHKAQRELWNKLATKESKGESFVTGIMIN